MKCNRKVATKSLSWTIIMQALEIENSAVKLLCNQTIEELSNFKLEKIVLESILLIVNQKLDSEQPIHF
jgi:hypothetical protein